MYHHNNKIARRGRDIFVAWLQMNDIVVDHVKEQSVFVDRPEGVIEYVVATKRPHIESKIVMQGKNEHDLRRFQKTTREVMLIFIFDKKCSYISLSDFLKPKNELGRTWPYEKKGMGRHVKYVPVTRLAHLFDLEDDVWDELTKMMYHNKFDKNQLFIQ